MSPKPIGLDSSVQQLVDEGYEVEILHSFLLIHSVPYVTPEREIKLGTLVCAYSGTPGVAGRPNDHTIWFAGAQSPCYASPVVAGPRATPIRAMPARRAVKQNGGWRSCASVTSTDWSAG